MDNAALKSYFWHPSILCSLSFEIYRDIFLYAHLGCKTSNKNNLTNHSQIGRYHVACFCRWYLLYGIYGTCFMRSSPECSDVYDVRVFMWLLLFLQIFSSIFANKELLLVYDKFTAVCHNVYERLMLGPKFSRTGATSFFESFLQLNMETEISYFSGIPLRCRFKDPIFMQMVATGSIRNCPEVGC